MKEMSILDKLLDEDNDELIVLAAENGEKKEFEQVAVVSQEDGYFAILRPMDMPENQVVVFRLDEYDEDAMDLVLDEKLANKILEVYAKDENE